MDRRRGLKESRPKDLWAYIGIGPMDISGADTDPEFLRLFRLGNWENIQRYLNDKYPPPKKLKKFAFTFTTNEDPGLQSQEKMTMAAFRLFNQQTTPVREGRVFLEYTEEGRPHLHGWYVTETGGRIFAKTFKRCWDLWGETKNLKRFAGGYHEEMKSERYTEYASAEGRWVVKKDATEDYAQYNTEVASKYTFEKFQIDM